MRTAAAILLWAGAAAADDWPQFRGPTGLGTTAEKGLPVEWGPGKNVLWTAPLVGDGHASPIVWKDRLFITTVRWADGRQDKTVIPEHHVLCYSTADGKRLWDATLEPGPWRRDDFRSGAGGGYAAPTPATDGERVYVAFGSSVLAAFDLEGKPAWRTVLSPQTWDVTLGSSPVLHGDTVILLCAMAKAADSRLVAFGKADGQVKWESKMPKTGFGHSTPILIEVKGKKQLLTVASGGAASGEALMAFDPADGKRLWWCKGSGDASSPAFGAGIVYADSGRGGDGFAVDPTGDGDVTKTHLKWTAGPLSEAICSPIIVGEHVLRMQSNALAKVWKAADGQQTDQQRLKLHTPFWASPVADGEGRVYFVPGGGRSVVVQAGEKLKVLAENDLGDPHHATPAFAGGRIYISGQKNLYCVGSR